MSRYIYLHGFASGTSSRKARFFQGHLNMEAPDLAEGDFENLTISGQMRVIERVVGGESVTLIGSSLGGYLAALYAARHPEVEKLVLLAPAFDFAHRWETRIGEAGIDEWKRTGKLPVFHYGDGRMRNLGIAMYQDSPAWEAWPEFSQPALIFHGKHDDLVPVAASLEFAKNHPNAKVVVLNSGHELTDVLEEIWEGTRTFLNL